MSDLLALKKQKVQGSLGAVNDDGTSYWEWYAQMCKRAVEETGLTLFYVTASCIEI